MIPPHNLASEAVVIEAGSLAGSYGHRLFDEARAIVKAEDFYSPTLRAAFEAICELRDQGQPVDSVLVAAKAGLDVCDLYELDSQFTGNVVSHARIVADTARKRRLAVAFEEAHDLILKDDEPRARELLTKAFA